MKYKRFDMDNLPIFPNDEYVLDNSKQDRFEVIKTLIYKADKIIIGTDQDRENEENADNILQFTDMHHQTINNGRVQSPSTYLIYQREKEIENFVKEKFYKIYGVFKHENGAYKGETNIKTKSKDEVLAKLKKFDINPNDSGEITQLETVAK